MLQQAKVPLANADLCNRTYSRPKYKIQGFKITPSMLCTGTVNGTFDPCHGDSGGPLICENKTRDRSFWYVWGVISWGDRVCAQKDLYSVYANVQKSQHWISSIVFGRPKKMVQQ